MKALHYTLIFLGCCRMASCGKEDTVPAVPPDNPNGGQQEYVDLTAGYKERGNIGSMEDFIPQESPRDDCYYNYFCLCNDSDHKVAVHLCSKYTSRDCYVYLNSKWTTLFAQEIFGTYQDGLIESFDDMHWLDIIYDDIDVAPPSVKPEMLYEFYSFNQGNDYTGTPGDESTWIKERFTDRRVRWVYKFTNEDYDRAVKLRDERINKYKP